MKKEEFEEAFRKYYTQLVSYAKTMIADEDDSRDIVEMAYEGVWRNLGSVEPDTVRGYLYRTVNHHAINLLRKRQLHRKYIDHYKAIATEAANEDTRREYEERLETAMRVVDTLKEPTRTILVRCYIDGKMYKEVAEELDVSVAMIKKHIGKALRMLAEFRQKMLKT